MRLRLKNDLCEIERLAEAVALFGRDNDLPEEAVFGLTLALEEVVTNAISYARVPAGVRWIDIQVEKEAGEIVARVEDDGVAFNPLEFPPPDTQKPLEERRPGGLGLFLVRKMMTGLEYRREKNKNVLVLRKKI
jgi:serine/threonine-protein kinase RsbW